MIILSIASVIMFPLIAGYVMGRAQQDPNTAEGRHYYAF